MEDESMNIENSNVFTDIPEELVSKYVVLNERAKEIDKELKELKKVINVYFDAKAGKNEKGEAVIGSYKVQRQVRSTENYQDEKLVQRLEELQLNDCIQIVKLPDQQKIEAAITLGLLEQ